MIAAAALLASFAAAWQPLGPLWTPLSALFVVELAVGALLMSCAVLLLVEHWRRCSSHPPRAAAPAALAPAARLSPSMPPLREIPSRALITPPKLLHELLRPVAGHLQRIFGFQAHPIPSSRLTRRFDPGRRAGVPSRRR